MSEVKLTKELQEILDRTERENRISNIIHDNDTLADALSAIYYFNKFHNSLSEIGINIDDTDFPVGLGWLSGLIKSELMNEFDNIPKEMFETDDYLDIIYGLHLTDGALIVSLSQSINWIQENR